MSASAPRSRAAAVQRASSSSRASPRAVRVRVALVFVDPGPGVIAVDADGRVVDDPPQRRRGGDRGRKALERRASAYRAAGSRRRWPRPSSSAALQPRLGLGAVECIGLDALAAQRGDALGGPRRSARLDPGLTLNEPPGAIADAEEEHPHRPRRRCPGDRPTSSSACRGRSASRQRLRPTWRRFPRASDGDESVRPMSSASAPISIAKRRLGDEVAGVRSDNAAADQALGLIVPQGLGQALVATERERAAARRPRKDGLAVFDPFRLGFRLRQARPGDFRIGVSNRGDGLGVKRGFVSARDFRRDLGLVRGLMRQHRLADDVADGEDVRHIGAHLAVDGE